MNSSKSNDIKQVANQTRLTLMIGHSCSEKEPSLDHKEELSGSFSSFWDSLCEPCQQKWCLSLISAFGSTSHYRCACSIQARCAENACGAIIAKPAGQPCQAGCLIPKDLALPSRRQSELLEGNKSKS